MKLYTAKEASEYLKVGVRSVQKRCVRYGVDKTDEGFMIPQSVIDKWQEKNQKTANIHRTSSERTLELETKVETLTKEADKLRQAIVQHQKLLRLITERLNKAPGVELEAPQRPPLGVIHNPHPESTDKAPSMNNPNFQSNYNPSWNKE